VQPQVEGPNGEDREEVTFVDVSFFGKQAEVINQYFQKGKPIFIEGRLKFDSWEDKQGGGKRSKLTVVIENFQFVGGPKPQGGDEEGDGNYVTDDRPPQRQQQRRPQPQRQPAPATFDEETQFKDDDIPF
jgi:single-strand DNA-binding protein